MDYTIQYGTVIGGTGAARCAADVLIREGRIAEVEIFVTHMRNEADYIWSAADSIRALTVVARVF